MNPLPPHSLRPLPLRSAAPALALLALASSAFWPASVVEAVRTEPAEKVRALEFLVGRWAGEMDGGRFEATYTPAGSDRLIGHSEFLKDGKVVFHEFEVFREVDRVLQLTPYPGGRPATTFRTLTIDWPARKVTCDHPTKDWPTRIVYHLVAADRLVITLSDPVRAEAGSEGKVKVYDLKRIP